MKSLAYALINFCKNLEPPSGLPEDVAVMNPYQNAETFKIVSAFYQKYYDDLNERFICFGINPGRFGAGITGVPFTDPIRLTKICGIENQFEQKAELSSKFIYEMIVAYGGPKAFYDKFYISAVSPLGYVREGTNLNYYDIHGFKALFEDHAVNEIKKQLSFGISTKVAFSIGKGHNINYLHWINKKHKLFDQIIPLYHPRWIMQYRLRQKEKYIEDYLSVFNSLRFYSNEHTKASTFG